MGGGGGSDVSLNGEGSNPGRISDGDTGLAYPLSFYLVSDRHVGSGHRGRHKGAAISMFLFVGFVKQYTDCRGQKISGKRYGSEEFPRHTPSVTHLLFRQSVCVFLIIPKHSDRLTRRLLAISKYILAEFLTNQQIARPFSAQLGPAVADMQ